MNRNEFWSIYNQFCRGNESANCSFKDYPLSGDHGAFEISVFENKEGKWCIESTIERSNDSHHIDFLTEEECFSNLQQLHGWDLIKLGFPKEILKK